MIDPAQIALNGLYPGWKPFHLATLGHFFQIKVFVEGVSEVSLTRRVTVMIMINRQSI